MNKRYSIIIPTIGRDTILGVLESIKKEAETDRSVSFEVIIIHDGVPTKTWEKEVIEYENLFSLQLIINKERLYSAGLSRNKGIDIARGDILIFLGDDTYIQPQYFLLLEHYFSSYKEKNNVLLGKINWTPELQNDPFHQWLLGNAQFDYASLDAGKTPTWRHFYTSNIALKKELIGSTRFAPGFAGWGFEDTEFGYSLSQKGMNIHYNPKLEVYHDHPQVITKVVQNTHNARKNALVFEQLHPELKVLPKGSKRLLLLSVIIILTPLSYISDRIHWWREWKKAWIGMK